MTITQEQRKAIREIHVEAAEGGYCVGCTEGWPCLVTMLLEALEETEHQLLTPRTGPILQVGKHDCLKYEVVTMDGTDIYSYCKFCGEVISA